MRVFLCLDALSDPDEGFDVSFGSVVILVFEDAKVWFAVIRHDNVGFASDLSDHASVKLQFKITVSWGEYSTETCIMRTIILDRTESKRGSPMPGST